ncbi:MAG: antitoxin [Caulobacterales bacterium]
MAEGKLFKVGGSQAVRLPKEFRMPGQKVRVRKDGNRVILEPIPEAPARDRASVRAWLAEIQALAAPEGFERPDQPAMQERDWKSFD